MSLLQATSGIGGMIFCAAAVFSESNLQRPNSIRIFSLPLTLRLLEFQHCRRESLSDSSTSIEPPRATLFCTKDLMRWTTA
jgi:hypothetical protein